MTMKQIFAAIAYRQIRLNIGDLGKKRLTSIGDDVRDKLTGEIHDNFRLARNLLACALGEEEEENSNEVR